MCGNFVEVVTRPQYESVEQYIDYLKRKSPTPKLKYELMDSDIKCTCCGQKAPHVAAGSVKVPDNTPFGNSSMASRGQQIWLCADCFNNGVRPKEVYFGSIDWNNMGERIKKRAEARNSSTW